MKHSIYTKNRASDWVTTKQLIAIGSEILILRLRAGHAYGSDRLGLVRRDLVLKKGAICEGCGDPKEDPIDPSELRIVEADSNRLNHDSPLTEPNKKTEINLGEYIVLKNTSGRNLALGNVQVGQGGNWWQFSATDTLVPNAYALVCYGTVVDQTQFLSANNLPLALTTDPTVQWHWQSTIDFPDAEGQATVRLFENGKPGATLDQVYWNPDGLQAINAHCDATCQVDPNREAVVSLQLDDYTYDPINPWDASKWTTAEATAKGKGSSQPEAPTAVRGLLKKEYELKDHLGNVHVVVTDRKYSTILAGPSIGEFKADVVVMRDYYPFGMEMEGQGYAAGEYRYGFNGMERDDEMKGNGVSYDFGARMYDPRVGRWMSRDPLEGQYPAFAPYVMNGNNPVLFVDEDGEKFKIYFEVLDKKGKVRRRSISIKTINDIKTAVDRSNNSEFVKKVVNSINYNRAGNSDFVVTEDGREGSMMSFLIEMKEEVTIVEGDSKYNSFNPKNNSLSINLDNARKSTDALGTVNRQSASTVFFEESVHAFRKFYWGKDGSDLWPNGRFDFDKHLQEERLVDEMVNRYSLKKGEDPRTDYTDESEYFPVENVYWTGKPSSGENNSEKKD